MELTERKKKVLRSVVDLYIRTAEPVGSKAITELPDMNYSSATIRNEMADLTTMGYLEQPHTSAGRIPSAAGFRPGRWQKKLRSLPVKITFTFLMRQRR